MANEKKQTDKARPDESSEERADIIEQRLIDERRTDQQEIISAAQEEFVEDQKDPNHPSRKERSHGVEDPTHSKGSTRRKSG